ncbi:MAG: hypothetical protein ACOX28_02020 [Bacilli bacterium]|jgi:hypothetical protein
MMITFSLLSFLIALAVFYITRVIVTSIGFAVGSVNYLWASMLVIVISCFVISLIFTYQEFKRSPNGVWKNQYFHRRLFTRFLINVVFLVIINLIWT